MLRITTDWLRSIAGWRAGLAAASLGAASALALPPLHVVPVLLVCVPGLLLLIGGASSFKLAAWRGFLFGLGHHVVGLYWITEAILIESARYWWLVPLAVPALSALLALFIAVPCALARLAPAGWRRAVVLAGCWTLFDLARQFVGTGFPWNPWGSVWALPGGAGDIMLQPLAWIGTPGLTLLTVLLAASPVLRWRGLASAGVVLLAWIVFGLVRLAGPVPAAPGVTVALVQGNIPQGQKWDREVMLAAFQRQLALTRDAVASAPDGTLVVIWPETSSVFLLQADADARRAILDAAGRATAALVGGITFAKGRFTSLDDTANLPRNSLLALARDGTIEGSYDKWHLVPFGEFAPSWIPLSIKIVPGNLAFGTGPETLTVPGLPPFGAIICYEAIFPAQVVDERKRPAWLVNVTNDAWFGNSSGPRQHLAGVRMRAVEEGLPLMRAANTGISAGFDAKGRELGRIGMNVAATLTLRLPSDLGQTPFARGGLAIPGLLAVLAIAFGSGLNRKPIATKFR